MDSQAGTLLCQPDAKKGCSACCGLFNHRSLGRRFLVGVLEKNTENFSRTGIIRGMSEELPSGENVRDRGSYICSCQGFIAPGKPGCLIHPKVKGDDLRDRAFFGRKICDGFLCPAHSVLGDPEKKELIELVDDWYLYTVAVIDPESFLWILAHARESSGMADDRSLMKLIVAAALEIHAQRLDEYRGPVFCYALPEYDLAKGWFSLAAETPGAETERDTIRKTTARLVDKAGR